ncbi:MAG: sialidase family protein [Anaerolineae bacterium]|jgi:hypothetical protein
MKDRKYPAMKGIATRRIIPVMAVVAALLMVSVALAATTTETLVSPSATRFPKNKQNESPMAVNPLDASNAISGANDEIEEPDCTPETGGSSNCPFDPNTNTTGVYVTTNGGANWSQQILDWSSADLVSDGDPVVAFGPQPDGDGGFSYDNGARAYFASLAGSPNYGPNQELLAVSYSDNKGMTWSAPVVATTRDNPVNFNDKVAIWADANPDSPYFGNVYVSWTLFTGNFPPPSFVREGPVFLPSPIMIARSTDGGLTFGKPRQLTPAHNNGAVGGRQGSTIRTAPNGDVYVFWEDGYQRQSAILSARSTDGGASFGRPFLVSFISDVPPAFPGASFRTNSFPMADIDADGNLYVVWPDYTDGHAVVKLAKSTNGGAAWDVSTAGDVTGRSAFYPAVAVAGSHVFIGFNAIDDVPEDTKPGAGVVFYDAYYVFSSDGGDSFGAPVKISAASSDPDVATANSLTAQFVGDYNGAAASPDGSFWFSWTDTRNGATCAAVDDWRASGFETTKPNIYDSCDPAFGNSDIYVAHVTP